MMGMLQAHACEQPPTSSRGNRLRGHACEQHSVSTLPRGCCNARLLSSLRRAAYGSLRGQHAYCLGSGKGAPPWGTVGCKVVSKVRVHVGPGRGIYADSSRSTKLKNTSTTSTLILQMNRGGKPWHAKSKEDAPIACVAYEPERCNRQGVGTSPVQPYFGLANVTGVFFIKLIYMAEAAIGFVELVRLSVLLLLVGPLQNIHLDPVKDEEKNPVS
ncbi:hypothetical protein L7F22_027467, partial [Adiantum nelumboides]|nr:hypothetical protein [Adiantum nelumboides]